MGDMHLGELLARSANEFTFKQIGEHLSEKGVLEAPSNQLMLEARAGLDRWPEPWRSRPIGQSLGEWLKPQFLAVIESQMWVGSHPSLSELGSQLLGVCEVGLSLLRPLRPLRLIEFRIDDSEGKPLGLEFLSPSVRSSSAEDSVELAPIHDADGQGWLGDADGGILTTAEQVAGALACLSPFALPTTIERLEEGVLGENWPMAVIEAAGFHLSPLRWVPLLRESERMEQDRLRSLLTLLASDDYYIPGTSFNEEWKRTLSEGREYAVDSLCGEFEFGSLEKGLKLVGISAKCVLPAVARQVKTACFDTLIAPAMLGELSRLADEPLALQVERIRSEHPMDRMWGAQAIRVLQPDNLSELLAPLAMDPYWDQDTECYLVRRHAGFPDGSEQ